MVEKLFLMNRGREYNLYPLWENGPPMITFERGGSIPSNQPESSPGFYNRSSPSLGGEKVADLPNTGGERRTGDGGGTTMTKRGAFLSTISQVREQNIRSSLENVPVFGES